MKHLERLLVVIDPTTSKQPALSRAIELGKQFGAALELLICDRDPVIKGRYIASPPGRKPPKCSA